MMKILINLRQNDYLRSVFLNMFLFANKIERGVSHAAGTKRGIIRETYCSNGNNEYFKCETDSLNKVINILNQNTLCY